MFTFSSRLNQKNDKFVYPIRFGNSTENVSANQALERLKDGNKRFISNQAVGPHRGMDVIKKTSHSQHPFVAMLSCSDSRVLPEVVFDQGIGDIFETKNAGNILDKATIGSLEYAVSHLGVNLIVVMGHDDCGAVKASMSKQKEKSIYLNSITHYIYPSIKEKNSEFLSDRVHSVAEENCNRTVKKLKQKSAIISNAVNSGTLKVIPAMYDVETGYVNFQENCK